MSFVPAGVITRRNSPASTWISMSSRSGRRCRTACLKVSRPLPRAAIRACGPTTDRVSPLRGSTWNSPTISRTSMGGTPFKLGADETGYKIWNRVPSAANVTGFFGFTGSWTGNSGWPNLPHSNGNSFADFLLGTANSSQTSATGAYASWLYTRYWGFYGQDTWQATPRLTHHLRFAIRVSDSLALPDSTDHVL